MARSLEPIRSNRVAERARNRALARIEDAALVNAHKMHAVGYVASAGISAITLITLAEHEAAKVAPGVELRLAALTDAATAVAQSVVLDLRYRL